jgi:hypothetical protein
LKLNMCWFILLDNKSLKTTNHFVNGGVDGEEEESKGR